MRKLFLVFLVCGLCGVGCALDRRPWTVGWEAAGPADFAGAAGADALEDAGQEAPDAFLAGEDAEDEGTYPDAGQEPADAGAEAPDAAQEPEDAENVAERTEDAGQELADVSAAADAALEPGTQCEACGSFVEESWVQIRECIEGYDCTSQGCAEHPARQLDCNEPETERTLTVTPGAPSTKEGNCRPVNMTCEEWLAKYGS